MVVRTVDIDRNGLPIVKFVLSISIDNGFTFLVSPFGFSGPSELRMGICPMSGSPGTVVHTGV